MNNNYRKKPNRSDFYQSVLLEVSFPHELLDIFNNDDSLYKRLNPFSYNDEVEILQDQLKVELWRIIEENLSDRQKEIVKLYASGLTQTEVAKKLGINQSSIVKAISGSQNHTYTTKKDNVGKNTTSGGIKSKLRKVVDTDPIVIAILQKISDIRNSDPF